MVAVGRYYNGPLYNVRPTASINRLNGGNIFKRGLGFITRNAGRLLRGASRLLPGLLDSLVSEGTKRGHILQQHKDVYDRFSKYVHRAPSFFNPYIERLERRINTQQRPLDRIDTTLDNIAQKGIKKGEELLKGLTMPKEDKVASTQVEPVGGNVGKKSSTKGKTKGKTKVKSTASKKSKPPKKGTSEYINLLDQMISNSPMNNYVGGAIVTHSLK